MLIGVPQSLHWIWLTTMLGCWRGLTTNGCNRNPTPPSKRLQRPLAQRFPIVAMRPRINMEVNYSKVILKALAEIRRRQIMAAKFNPQTADMYPDALVHAIMHSIYPIR